MAEAEDAVGDVEVMDLAVDMAVDWKVDLQRNTTNYEILCCQVCEHLSARNPIEENCDLQCRIPNLIKCMPNEMLIVTYKCHILNLMKDMSNEA